MVLVGQNNTVIRYRSFRNELNREAVEVMIFGDDGKVIESIAFYDEVWIKLLRRTETRWNPL